MKHYLLLKVFLWISISVPLSLIIHYINKYVYNDWQFVTYLYILVFMDIATGMLYEYKNHNALGDTIRGGVINCALYAAILITLNTLMRFTIGGKEQDSFSWVNSVVLSLLIVHEAGSVFTNFAKIKPGVIPVSVLKRLSGFDSETGESLDKKNSN